MRKLISFLLFLPIVSKAQNKPYLEIGGVAGYFPKEERMAWGGNIGLNAKMNEYLNAGVGFMPIWMEKAKKPLLPVYADFRIRLDKNAALLLQPGYNFYKNASSANLSTASIKAETKGAFYGSAGLAINFPTQTNTGFYVQAKYNYFAFNNNVTTRTNNNTQSSSYNTHNEAITLGVGLRLQ